MNVFCHHNEYACVYMSDYIVRHFVYVRYDDYFDEDEHNHCVHTITTRNHIRVCFSHLAYKYVDVIRALQLLDMLSYYNEIK
jgi:hypothetical protein